MKADCFTTSNHETAYCSNPVASLFKRPTSRLTHILTEVCRWCICQSHTHSDMHIYARVLIGTCFHRDRKCKDKGRCERRQKANVLSPCLYLPEQSWH